MARPIDVDFLFIAKCQTNGSIAVNSLALYGPTSASKFIAGSSKFSSWRQAQESGWRVVRVRISEVLPVDKSASRKISLDE